MKYIHKEVKRPEWERWFAWKRVPIGRFPIMDGMTIMHLEWVERKWLEYRNTNRYEYRPILKDII